MGGSYDHKHKIGKIGKIQVPDHLAGKDGGRTGSASPKPKVGKRQAPDGLAGMFGGAPKAPMPKPKRGNQIKIPDNIANSFGAELQGSPKPASSPGGGAGAVGRKKSEIGAPPKAKPKG